MSAPLIVLASVGYFIVGWVSTISLAAMYPYKGTKYPEHQGQAGSYFWFTLPIWPLAWAFLVFLRWPLNWFFPASLKAARKLNPQLKEEWF